MLLDGEGLGGDDAVVLKDPAFPVAGGAVGESVGDAVEVGGGAVRE